MGASRGPLARAASIVGKAVAVNLLPEDLLDTRIPMERVQELFARFVDQVEIENHSFCNRLCWFCPNVVYDRRSALVRMTDPVFEGIVGALASIGYGGALTWSRYHEALADPSIFPRIARARSALPGARLVVISNGDYMRRGTLTRLEEAGVDRLMLDLYLPEGRERDPASMRAGVERFRRRTGAELSPCGPYHYRIASARTKVTLEIPCFTPASVSTRGGLLGVPKTDAYRRRAACMAPIRHLAIDYNGKGMLCCHTRSDAPDHAGAIIGDLSRPGYDLFHLYRDLGGARRALVTPGEKDGVCRTCDVRDDGPDRLARRVSVAGPLAWIPGMEAAATGFWRRTRRRRL